MICCFNDICCSSIQFVIIYIPCVWEIFILVFNILIFNNYLLFSSWQTIKCDQCLITKDYVQSVVLFGNLSVKLTRATKTKKLCEREMYFSLKFSNTYLSFVERLIFNSKLNRFNFHLLRKIMDYEYFQNSNRL